MTMMSEDEALAVALDAADGGGIYDSADRTRALLVLAAKIRADRDAAARLVPMWDEINFGPRSLDHEEVPR